MSICREANSTVTRLHLIDSPAPLAENEIRSIASPTPLVGNEVRSIASPIPLTENDIRSLASPTLSSAITLSIPKVSRPNLHNGDSISNHLPTSLSTSQMLQISSLHGNHSGKASLTNSLAMLTIEEVEEEVVVVDVDDPAALEAHINASGSMMMLDGDEVRSIETSSICHVQKPSIYKKQGENRHTPGFTHGTMQYISSSKGKSQPTTSVMVGSTNVKVNCVRSLPQGLQKQDQQEPQDHVSVLQTHNTISTPPPQDSKRPLRKKSIFAFFRQRFHTGHHHSTTTRERDSGAAQSRSATSTNRREKKWDWSKLFRKFRRNESDHHSPSYWTQRAVTPLLHHNDSNDHSNLTFSSTTYVTANSSTSVPPLAPTNPEPPSLPLLSSPVSPDGFQL